MLIYPLAHACALSLLGFASWAGRYVDLSQILRQLEVTNCDIKFILHLAQQFICCLLQFNKTEPLLAEVFD